MSQLMYATVGGLVAAGLVVIAPAQPRAGQPPAASAGGATCATSGCHLRVTQHQQVHQPVAEHQCEVCHVPKERSTPLQAGVRHEFRRAGDDPELCYACHDRLGEDDFVHEPVKMGVCILCHDPHGVDASQGGTGDHTALINFNMNIVLPHPSAGGPEFVDTGRFSGRCTLLCHGELHNNRVYPR